MTIDPNTAKEVLTVLNSDPAKELTKPVLGEIGAFLGDMANMARFYMTRNAERTFTAWAESRKGRPIQAEEVELILPLLPLVATVSDDDLQRRWAALLETASRGEADYLPAFGQTLSQLTAEETRFLHRIWKALSVNPVDYSLSPVRSATTYELFLINWPDMDPEFLHEGFIEPPPEAAPEVRLRFERLALGERMLDEFVRLGIFLETEKDDIVTSYFLTRYGEAFVRAVCPL